VASNLLYCQDLNDKLGYIDVTSGKWTDVSSLTILIALGARPSDSYLYGLYQNFGGTYEIAYKLATTTQYNVSITNNPHITSFTAREP